MKFLFDSYKKYKTLKWRIDSITSVKTVLLSTLIATVLAGLIALPVVVIIINLFFFVELMYYLIALIFILLILFVFMYQAIYMYFLKLLEPRISKINTKYVLIFDASFLSIVLVIVGLILTSYLLGVIG